MSIADTLGELMRVGLTSEPQPVAYFTDEPKLPIYQAQPLGPEGENPPDLVGQGADPDAQKAQLKAAAEALERLCLVDPLQRPAGTACFGEMEGQIDPADFYCYSARQVPDRDSELQGLRNAKLEWAPARDVRSGNAVLLPRQLLYLDTARREPVRIRRESISSGAALGKAGSGEAFSRGLFELVERDAFMGFWLPGRKPRRLQGFRGELASLLDMLERYRLDCRVFDIRSDLGAPAALAITVDPTGLGPAVTAGMGAAESYTGAVRSAVLESVAYRRSFRLQALAGEIPEVKEPAQIVSLESRISFWSRAERLQDLPGWWSAPAAASMDSLEGTACSTPELVKALHHRGFQVFQADITRPEVASRGFEVVRVVVPELHPLHISEAAQSLASKHLGEIAEDENLLPHPFA